MTKPIENSDIVPVPTEKEYSQHLNSKFYLKLEDGAIELQLVEVKPYPWKQNEPAEMERFSLFFEGPGVYLPQGLYHLEHEQMGAADIFLVPVSGNQQGYRYEAVFNTFKS